MLSTVVSEQVTTLHKIGTLACPVPITAPRSLQYAANREMRPGLREIDPMAGQVAITVNSPFGFGRSCPLREGRCVLFRFGRRRAVLT